MKKKKIAYILLIVIFIVAILITAIKGLRVDTYYGEGVVISFSTGADIELKDIKEIAKEVWPNQDILVQRVELFGDSASIKIKNDPTDEELTSLREKINEKYSVTTEASQYTTDYVSNVKLKTIVKPYILPIGISVLLILVFYAIRFRGTKQMLDLLKYLVIVEGLLFSAYAIIRIPVSVLALPIALSLYAITVIVYTAKANWKKEKANEE